MLLPTGVGGSVFMLRGRGGKRHQPALCSWPLSLSTLPLRGTLLEEQIISPLCVRGALQIVVSTLYAPRLFACLLSRSRAVPYKLYPS